MRVEHVVFSASLFAALAVGARAQAPAPQLAFEVASVKRNTSGDPGIQMGTQPGGRFTMENIPLRVLIRNAYQIQDNQLVDAPEWISTERFDIVAKMPGGAVPTPGNPASLGPMLRALLADRFKLLVHHATGELPVYELVLARSDGKLGPHLTPSTLDCAAIAAERQRAGGGAPAPQGSERPLCGVRANGGQMTAGGFPMSQLVTLLSPMVQRTVIDKTGLSGGFDLDLTWTPDQTAQGAATADPDRPSIFTALQEQLGLRLVSARGPIDVLVIDHVERPTEN